MGIFNSKTNKGTRAKAEKKPVEEILTPGSQQAANKEVATATAGKGQAGSSYRLLHSPRVSEKAAMLSAHNSYVLNVPVEANKIEIAKAVKDLYGVTVTGVRTLRGIGKILTRGRRVGQRKRWKKAIVTLKPGQKIDLYEGV